VCLFSVANGTLFVQNKLKFGVIVRVSSRSSVSATSFEHVIDFPCFERRWRPIDRYADALIAHTPSKTYTAAIGRNEFDTYAYAFTTEDVISTTESLNSN